MVEKKGTDLKILDKNIKLKFQDSTGLEILAPAGGFLASLERMFASLTYFTPYPPHPGKV